MRARAAATRVLRHGDPAAAGYTLVELVVTVLIISILAVLATRSYLKSVRVSNRTDAISTLTAYSQQLERCYSQFFSYQTYTGNTGTCLTAPPQTSGSTKGYYKITVNVPGGDPLLAQQDQYVITATALSTTVNASGATTSTSNIQYKDTSCRTFYITSLGVQLSADSSGNVSSGSSCWAVN